MSELQLRLKTRFVKCYSQPITEKFQIISWTIFFNFQLFTKNWCQKLISSSPQTNIVLEFELGASRTFGKVHVVLDHVHDLRLVLAFFVFRIIFATFVDFFAAIEIGFRNLKI